MKNGLTFFLQGPKSLVQKLRTLSLGAKTTTNGQQSSAQQPDDEKQPLASDNLVKVSDLDTKGDEARFKSVKNELEQLAESVSTEGRYNVLVYGISPLEDKGWAIAQEAGIQNIAPFRTPLNAAAGLLRRLLERRDECSDKDIQVRYLAEHDAENKAKIAKAKKNLNGINALQQCCKKAQAKKEACGHAKRHILNTVYKGRVPEMVTRLAKFGLWAIISVFGMGEAVLVNDSIGRMVDNDLNGPKIFITTVSIIVALVFSSHKLGQSLNVKLPAEPSAKEGEGSKQGIGRYLSTLLYGTAVFVLFAGICYIRFSTVPSTDLDTAGFSELMGAAGDGGGKDYLFILINLGFLLLVIGLSKHMHRHDDYYSLEEAEIGYMNLEAEYQKKEDDIRADVEAEVQQIESGALNDAQSYLVAYRKHEEEDIDQCKNIISGYRSHIKQGHAKLSIIHVNAIVSMRNNIGFAREREGLDPVIYADVPIKPLDFHNDIDLSDVYESTSHEQDETDKTGKASQNGIHKGPFANTLSALFLATSCLLFPSYGCGNDQQRPKPAGITLAYLSDWSITQDEASLLPSTEAQTLFLFKEAGFAPAMVSYDKMTFFTTHIGATSLVPMLRCELPEAMPGMVKAQRRKQQTAFGACVYEKIKTQNVQQGLKQSYIGAALSQVLPQLAASSDSLKVLLIASDMVFNEKEVANFYSYGDRLMQDYDSVARNIETAYPTLRDIDLSGLRCYVAYLPNDGTDKVAKRAREFWTKWFASKNGRIEFLPNLPEPVKAVKK